MRPPHSSGQAAGHEWEPLPLHACLPQPLPGTAVPAPGSSPVLFSGPRDPGWSHGQVLPPCPGWRPTDWDACSWCAVRFVSLNKLGQKAPRKGTAMEMEARLRGASGRGQTISDRGGTGGSGAQRPVRRGPGAAACTLPVEAPDASPRSPSCVPGGPLSSSHLTSRTLWQPVPPYTSLPLLRGEPGVCSPVLSSRLKDIGQDMRSITLTLGPSFLPS